MRRSSEEHELVCEAPRFNRRLALKLGGVSLLVSITPLACSSTDALHPRLPPVAMRSVTIPKFRTETLMELRDVARKKLGDGPFSVGQVIEDPAVVDAFDLTADLPGELSLQFKRGALKNAQSPVLAHEAKNGAIRFMQIAPEVGLSLVAGRAEGKDDVPNVSVFRVEEEWLRRLIADDTCMRAVAGDTTPVTPCGIDGCPILISRQRFVHPSGEIETLLFPVPGNYSQAVTSKHDLDHIRSAKHCNASPGEMGKCKLDCAQTAK